MHHVGGITEAKRIVCLNVDPKAAIFPNADEGFVADAREVLPRLVREVRAAVGGEEPRSAVASAQGRAARGAAAEEVRS
jgi:hypothetical protein